MNDTGSSFDGQVNSMTFSELKREDFAEFVSIFSNIKLLRGLSVDGIGAFSTYLDTLGNETLQHLGLRIFDIIGKNPGIQLLDDIEKYLKDVTILLFDDHVGKEYHDTQYMLMVTPIESFPESNGIRNLILAIRDFLRANGVVTAQVALTQTERVIERDAEKEAAISRFENFFNEKMQAYQFGTLEEPEGLINKFVDAMNRDAGSEITNLFNKFMKEVGDEAYKQIALLRSELQAQASIDIRVIFESFVGKLISGIEKHNIQLGADRKQDYIKYIRSITELNTPKFEALS